MTNFGASFKKARESRGISLDQIAKDTRISTRFLKAIEDEEFHQLPGGIFNRGFVRSFAQAIGLDPEQAVADYERLVSTHEPNDLTGMASSRPPRDERRLYPIAVGILALAIAIFYIAARESSRPAEAPTTPAPAVEQPTPPVAPPANATPAPTEPTTAPGVSEPEPTPPPTASNQGLTLDVKALQTTWIKVTSDGNSSIPGEILRPGMTRKFSAENSIKISIGNAGGLTIKINDMPAKPLGKAGEVRSVTITSANIKDFTG